MAKKNLKPLLRIQQKTIWKKEGKMGEETVSCLNFSFFFFIFFSTLFSLKLTYVKKYVLQHIFHFSPLFNIRREKKILTIIFN